MPLNPGYDVLTPVPMLRPSATNIEDLYLTPAL